MPMRYTRISADCHIDLPWLPADLFTANASAALRERMPYVSDGPDGPYWTSKKGATFGLVGGVGPFWLACPQPGTACAAHLKTL